jgi:hypothetical protein
MLILARFGIPVYVSHVNTISIKSEHCVSVQDRTSTGMDIGNLNGVAVVVDPSRASKLAIFAGSGCVIFDNIELQ